LLLSIRSVLVALDKQGFSGCSRALVFAELCQPVCLGTFFETESIQTGGMGVHRRRIGRGRDRRSDKKARGNGLYTTRNHCLTKKTTFKWLRVTWDETHIKVRGQQSKGGGLRIDRTVRKGRQALGHGLEGSQGVGPARWTEGLRTRELHSCGNTKERGGGPRLIH